MRPRVESVEKERRSEKKRENQEKKSKSVNKSEREGERSAGMDVEQEKSHCHSFLWEPLRAKA